MKCHYFLSVLSLVLAGCSIISEKPERTAALTRVASWKYVAERKAKTAPQKCESEYVQAQSFVNGWLEKDVQARGKSVAHSIFFWTTIDLGTATIPPDVSAAVQKFENCGVQQWSLSKKDTADVSLEIGKWIVEQVKASRNESATELQELLSDLKWKSWEDLRPKQ